MLMPKKVKHRRVMKGRMRGTASRGDKLNFGDFGLKTLEAAWITDRQIEAARIAMTRHIKRGRKNLDSDVSRQADNQKNRLKLVWEAAKARPDHWVAVVKPGRILYEIQGVSEELAREAMNLAAQKLPVKTKFVNRADLGRRHRLRDEEKRNTRTAQRDGNERIEGTSRQFERIAVSPEIQKIFGRRRYGQRYSPRT
jgi:large subunit ribosomal protein L16